MKLLQRALPLANTGKEFYLFSLFQGLTEDNIDSMYLCMFLMKLSKMYFFPNCR